jgi:uncharacterized protein YgbK (DUF1537 family)
MTKTDKYISAQSVFGKLPPEMQDNLSPLIILEREKMGKTIVVLDDDPTGTQTVHDVLVLTSWSVEDIEAEFRRESEVFYILTNSRSLTASAANDLAREIGKNLREASRRTGRKFLVVSRSDSTLRGHYPNEVESLAKSIELEDAVTFLIPAFFEGGRYTVEDVHYMLENDQLIPVSETPFALDKSFGFKNANLKKYVEEKTNGAIKAKDVNSLSIHELRSLDGEAIALKINSLPRRSVCIVNAALYRDLEVFALSLYRSGREVILRTAASIVPVLAGIKQKPLLDRRYFMQGREGGVIVIVGSYVPKTSAQLDQLRKLESARFLELDVNRILRQAATFKAEVVSEIDRSIRAGEDVVVFTSRKLIADRDPEKSLVIGQKVSKFITDTVKSLQEKPGAIIAKGGITSSDVATKALGVKKALVVGQVAAGVPVWRLGKETKFPGINYVVFPGNVGTSETLRDVFLLVSRNSRIDKH